MAMHGQGCHLSAWAVPSMGTHGGLPRRVRGEYHALTSPLCAAGALRAPFHRVANIILPICCQAIECGGLSPVEADLPSLEVVTRSLGIKRLSHDVESRRLEKLVGDK